MQVQQISGIVLGLIACGILTKIAINTEETKNESRVISGKIQKLEAEVKQIKTVLYESGQTVVLSQKERECLIKNVFYEAGVEPIEGKIAVAQTTMNRVKHSRWPDDVCKVVYQRKQFSWTLDKKKRNAQPAGPLYTESVKAVKMFKSGIRVRGVGKAHFYHTDYIKPPKWADSDNQIAVIGQHIFYSEDKKL